MTFTTTLSDGQYVAKRAADAAKLVAEMVWTPGTLRNVLHCRLYNMSILWDPAGAALHAGDWCRYEVLRDGADDIECFRTQEDLLAHILRRYW